MSITFKLEPGTGSYEADDQLLKAKEFCLDMSTYQKKVVQTTIEAIVAELDKNAERGLPNYYALDPVKREIHFYPRPDYPYTVVADPDYRAMQGRMARRHA